MLIMYDGVTYRVTHAAQTGCYNQCQSIGGGAPFSFGYMVYEDGRTNISDGWVVQEKIIPDIPLDPSLPILEAGYLQDRQRKRYRNKK